ncbi:MAG: hypothetical protein ACK5KL_19095 [Dysgonomonas sp.]
MILRKSVQSKRLFLRLFVQRFTTVDPMAEKYYSISPYAYVANNPMNAIDLRGDSISVISIIAYDKSNGTNHLQSITNDLQTITGLTYSVSSTGMLVYNKDADGNAIISHDNKGNLIGSESARDHITDIIGKTTDIINAGIIPESLNRGSEIHKKVSIYNLL